MLAFLVYFVPLQLMNIRAIVYKAVPSSMSDRHTTSLPHPIHDIPPELLSEILIQCTPLRYTSVSERCSIIALSCVCKRWRTVALSTHLLWTSILFRCQWQEDIPRELDCARAWLSRSGNCTLAIHISLPGGESENMDTRACFKAALELLTLHCMHWREIKFFIPHWDTHEFPQVNGKIPLLESADLGIVRSHTLINGFAIAPRLRRLRLVILPSYQPALVTFPWNQLVHLDVRADNTSVLHMLALASNIAFLKVTLSGEVSLGAESKTITNSSTSKLHLFCRLPAGEIGRELAINYFLDHLVLPALCKFRLSESKPGRSVISFISRSACSLSSLQIEMCPTPDFVELMKLLHTLQELSVAFKSVGEWDAMVECFTFQRDCHLAPNLRSLILHAPRWFEKNLSLSRFANMVESRWTPGGAVLDARLIRSPLKHVQVYCCQIKSIVRSNIALIRLRGFLEEGLGITLLTNDEPPRHLF